MPGVAAPAPVSCQKVGRPPCGLPWGGARMAQAVSGWQVPFAPCLSGAAILPSLAGKRFPALSPASSRGCRFSTRLQTSNTRGFAVEPEKPQIFPDYGSNSWRVPSRVVLESPRFWIHHAPVNNVTQTEVVQDLFLDHLWLDSCNPSAGIREIGDRPRRQLSPVTCKPHQLDHECTVR